jgi:hypothetical protein
LSQFLDIYEYAESRYQAVPERDLLNVRDLPVERPRGPEALLSLADLHLPKPRIYDQSIFFR